MNWENEEKQKDVAESKSVMFNYDSSLEAFIRDEFRRQQQEDLNKDQLDSVKIRQFFERALSETQRMNDIIRNSHEQRNLLRKEFGLRMFNEWLKEHHAEVLNTLKENNDRK